MLSLRLIVTSAICSLPQEAIEFKHYLRLISVISSMSLDSDGHAVSRRKALKVAVAALCSEVGFGMAEDAAIETLTELLQACKLTVLIYYYR